MPQHHWCTDTYVIDVVHKGIVRLHKFLVSFQLWQLLGNAELHIGQAIFAAELVVWRDNIQTLIEITVLIHITVQNARRNFGRCIVHCVEQEK